MSDKSNSQKNLWLEDLKIKKSCPTCGKKMEKGFLNTSGGGIQRVFIQPEMSESNSSVLLSTSVLFCRDCKRAFLILD